MNANPVILQMKYARIVNLFAELAKINPLEALDFFYKSEEYKLISRGVGDLHCMSDGYLAEDLLIEFNNAKDNKN